VRVDLEGTITARAVDKLWQRVLLVFVEDGR
jgi:hypothetical protein